MGIFRSLSKNESGLTLVELMVSTALFGVSAFTMAILLAENSKRTIMAQSEAKLSESLLDFSNTLDVLLANTTRVNNCQCGTPECVFSDTGVTPSPDCSRGGGCGTTTRECALSPQTCASNTAIFSMEIEDSSGPIQPRTAECLPSPASNGMIARGCKRLIEVYLSEPEPISVVADQPTRVPLAPVISIADVTDPDRIRVISSLEGVISFRCGQAPLDPLGANLIPANRQFHYRLEAKVRRDKRNLSTDENVLEGWTPDDPNFFSGPRREISSTIAFRNLNTYGIHFGKTQSDSDCHPDGGVSELRPDANCCSGYWVGTPSGDGTASTCLAARQCVPRGGNPLDPGPDGVPATGTLTAVACCSHRLNPDGSSCL